MAFKAIYSVTNKYFKFLGKKHYLKWHNLFRICSSKSKATQTGDDISKLAYYTYLFILIRIP